jgi:hypothetical protein
MLRLRLSIIFSLLLISAIVRVSGRNDSKPLTPIPLADILRDLKDLQRPNRSDLIAESQPELKRTLVGLKKHKNYEIVLYEYSDEEDINLGRKTEEISDFEDFSSPPNSENRKFNDGLGRKSYISRNSSEEDTTGEQKKNKSRRPSSKKGSKAADYLGEDVIRENDSEEEQEDTPFVWGQRDEPRGNPRANKPTLTNKPKNPPKNEEEDDDSDRTSSTPASFSSTGRPQSHRLSLEDAPGAGRFIPRPRKPSGTPSPKVSEDEEEEEEEVLDEEEQEENESPKECRDPNGKIGTCQQYFKCPALYASAERLNLHEYKCKLGKEIGICCPQEDLGGQPGLYN